jgi:hypothetical protein
LTVLGPNILIKRSKTHPHERNTNMLAVLNFTGINYRHVDEVLYCQTYQKGRVEDGGGDENHDSNSNK